MGNGRVKITHFVADVWHMVGGLLKVSFFCCYENLSVITHDSIRTAVWPRSIWKLFRLDF